MQIPTNGAFDNGIILIHAVFDLHMLSLQCMQIISDLVTNRILKLSFYIFLFCLCIHIFVLRIGNAFLVLFNNLQESGSMTHLVETRVKMILDTM